MTDLDLTCCSHSPPLQSLVIYILCGLAGYLLTLSFRHLRALFTLRQRSLRLVLSLQKPLENREFNTALSLCQRAPDSPMARVLAATLQTYHTLAGHRELRDDLHRTVSTTKARLLHPLRQQLSGLATIAIAAPGVGMFATLVGMANVMAHSQRITAAAVAAGFGRSLTLTAAGLSVAIVAVAIYGYLRGTLDALALDLDEVSGELIACLTRPSARAFSYRSAPLRPLPL